MPDSDKLRAAIARLGISQRGLARELDISERVVRYYCAGALPVPAVVWLAIETLEHRSGVKKRSSLDKLQPRSPPA